MNERTMDKQAWVAMFREIGLDEPQMRRWHAVFERDHPSAHAEFLEWLSIPGEEAEKIRQASRGAWAGD